ncbi:alpha/beta hydrolase family esterase [Aeromicrobium chenweiae]|uniref:Serine aminopeptidase S33 domain-containing protein n=1 Tax=Aeromicrobium chenweiae TaxID=2079793 RepID=A0A2S0WS45_9ACTN|nr:alpha/beta hydrolase [Aeromicrobium chenweiae]AWB94142.1 hypothetical protein C3E78_10525 [Aeromicrobium chenweiae]TGN33587.1 hypothetical protein E4L97_00565 [Aeromicrobium chenweiae]
MRTTIDVDGRPRTYTVIANRDSSQPRDLVLVFHGSRQDAEAHRKFTGHSFDALAENGEAVVAYLDGHKGNWNDARKESYFPARIEDVDDVGFTRAVIRQLTATHRIAPDHVFAVGYSNGGQMVLRLVHEIPDLLAGAAVLSAPMPAPDNLLLPPATPKYTPLPVLLMHGTQDRVVPYRGGAMAAWARRLFKVGGSTLSAPETAQYFARRNGISSASQVSRLPRRNGASGKTWVEQTDYREAGHPPVRLLTVHGAGHTIPGPRRAPFILGRTNQDISAATVIAEFFGITVPARSRP